MIAVSCGNFDICIKKALTVNWDNHNVVKHGAKGISLSFAPFAPIRNYPYLCLGDYRDNVTLKTCA